MKKILACAAIIALAACSEEPAPEPQPVETVAPVVEPSLPAPNEASFAEAYAEACPNAEQVSTSLCRSQGLGTNGFVCDYGLGRDEYRRHSATLAAGEGKWIIADPENTCVAG